MRLIKALWRRGRNKLDEVEPQCIQISLSLNEHGWLDEWLDECEGREIASPEFLQKCALEANAQAIQVHEYPDISPIEMPLWLNGIDSEAVLAKAFRQAMVKAYHGSEPVASQVAQVVAKRLADFAKANHMSILDGIVYGFEGNHSDSEAHFLLQPKA